MYSEQNMATERTNNNYSHSFIKQYFNVKEENIIDIPSFKGINDPRKLDIIKGHQVQWWQDKHVDILVDIGDKYIYIDNKGTKRDTYSDNFLTFELLRRNDKAGGIIEEGWTELVDEFPHEDQYILHISKQMAAITKKIDFHICKNLNWLDFNTSKIRWWKDQGVPDGTLWKKNKLLYLTRFHDLMLLKQMNTKIYEIGPSDNKWYETSEYYYDVPF